MHQGWHISSVPKGKRKENSIKQQAIYSKLRFSVTAGRYWIRFQFSLEDQQKIFSNHAWMEASLTMNDQRNSNRICTCNPGRSFLIYSRVGVMVSIRNQIHQMWMYQSPFTNGTLCVLKHRCYTSIELAQTSLLPCYCPWKDGVSKRYHKSHKKKDHFFLCRKNLAFIYQNPTTSK